MERRRSIIRAAVVCCALIATVCPSAGAQVVDPNTPYSGGSGTAKNPYQIATPQDLITLGQTPADHDKHFILTADIDLSGYTFTESVIASYEILTRSTPEGAPFYGRFAGDNHVIRNLHCEGTGRLALFGYLADSAVVSGLGLEGVSIQASGGLLGGLASFNAGTISNCYCGGEIGGDETSGSSRGGLVGINSGVVSNCYSTGSVTGQDRVGGLAGGNSGTIQDCYTEGVVVGSGTCCIGGLVGHNDWAGIVVNCFSTGMVTGNDAGGLIGGSFSDDNVVNCFWDIETSGIDSSEGGLGRNTAAMQTASTYIGWGIGTWTIDDGNDYPRLWWEGRSGVAIESTTTYPMQAGTEEDPILIYTAEELALIGRVSDNWDRCFKLMADVNMVDFKGASLSLIGDSEGQPFTGIFDGNGHVVSNLQHTSDGSQNIGLFRYVEGGSAEIKNLGLVDVNIQGEDSSYVGALVGYLHGGIVRDCCVTGGTVSGVVAGGLVGHSLGGTISDCYSQCCVICRYDPNDSSQVNTKSQRQPHLRPVTNPPKRVGGLIGYNTGWVRNCYGTGLVIQEQDTGGLVGWNYHGQVKNSFWDTETSGQTDTWSSGTGLTTAEMMDIDTFLEAGWDFVDETGNGTDDIWWIADGVDYPRLWWELE